MINRYIQPILVLTGLGTLAGAVLFLFPSMSAVLFHVQITGDAALFFLRHWGLEVGCLGAMLIYSAYDSSIRNVVMASALISKVGAVYLLLSQYGKAELSGFALVIGFDSVCVLLYFVYLLNVWRSRSR